jgi:hypothetical protein
LDLFDNPIGCLPGLAKSPALHCLWTEVVQKLKFPATLEPVQNLEFWRLQRQNSTLQAPKEPEYRDFCGLLTAKIYNLNRLLEVIKQLYCINGLSGFMLIV